MKNYAECESFKVLVQLKMSALKICLQYHFNNKSARK